MSKREAARQKRIAKIVAALEYIKKHQLELAV